jgi:hypothetical protein
MPAYFRKLATVFYCYSNGVHYARIKRDGREIRRSLQTTDCQIANRDLAEKDREVSQPLYDSLFLKTQLSVLITIY